MPSVYDDDAKVGDLTRPVVNAGYRVLQIHKLGETDREHVAALLEHFDPPRGAHILDAGCGIGEVAKLMAEARPDLDFTLLNISPAQLAMCPKAMEKKEGRLEEMPFGDACFDAVMINYALGHADLEPTLSEAARVLRRNGVLFIYDMTADPDQDCLVASMQYQLHSSDEVATCAKLHGLVLNRKVDPETNMKDFTSIVRDDEVHKLLATVRPIVYRFVKV